MKRKTLNWSSHTSKWKAAQEKGLDVSIKDKDNILYLGASSGTTISHISKLTNGIIFAVENSPQMAIRLINLSEKSKNIAPIFSDARNIDYIKKSIFEKNINILFQDIPSVDQTNILINASNLINTKCKILFSLKTQSISQQNPKQTLKEAKQKLARHFKILQIANLEPFHKKHYFFVMKKK